MERISAKRIKTAMPTTVSPMLCMFVKEPFDDANYLFEVKWDGYRIISFLKGTEVKLHSRSQNDYTKKYPPIVKELSKLNHKAVIDGEVIAIDENGKPSFDLLQKYNGSKPLQYYCFDILWLDGYDLTDLPLTQRKEMLQGILPNSDILKYSSDFDNGIALFDSIKQMGMEGIVAKLRQSPYAQGERGQKWLKMQTEIRGEYVIGGWTESERSRSFRSILFGNYQNGKLFFLGHAGGGFKDKEMPGLLARLKKIEVKQKPFANDVDTSTKVHWVKPELVGNFKFATFTRSGKVRKPAIFLGLREDKLPIEVVPEPVLSIDSSPTESAKETETIKKWRKLEARKVTSRETFHVGKFDMELTNVEQEIWHGIAKAQLIQYYHSVSKVMLPYLANRPLSLYIKHNGIHAEGMYIKDMVNRQPDFATVFTTPRKHKKDNERETIDYLVCNNEATLLWITNLGCIDVNPWTSTTALPEQPNHIVIDLDPSEDDFKKVVETAKAAKVLFDRLKLKAFPKTSGKTGIHLYIPCKGFSFSDARIIAENICNEIHEIVPKITTTNVSVSSRGNKVYIDPNQNDFADTVAAAYSVRPWKMPMVSTPLDWREINSSLTPDKFTIQTIPSRIKLKGDLFAGVNNATTQITNSKKLLSFLTQ